jgi:hypothetical protein
MRVVDYLLRAVVDQLYIGLRNTEVSAEGDLLDRQHLRVELRIAQVFAKVANVLDLAWLCNPIALFLETFPGIVLHHFFFVLEDPHK